MKRHADPQPADASAPERHTFLVERARHGSRLDSFLADRLRENGLSREKIKGLIREGKVTVDGNTETSPKSALATGSEVAILAERPPSSLTAESGDIEILYRDAVLAVVNKPAGLTVHPAPNQPTGTLAHRLLAHFPELAAQEGFRPGIVHRLDKDTSGLMLVALTEQCRLALAGQFARHEVYKEYLALTRGVFAAQDGIIDEPIGRHPSNKTKMAVTPHGKPAKSAWRVLYADPRGGWSLVAVRIFSGRTHQVRVHMRHLGHSLLGDALYRSAPPRQAGNIPVANDTARAGFVSRHSPQRQMLHAWKLAFTHPLPDKAGPSLTGKLPKNMRREGDALHFCCPPPSDFGQTVRALVRQPLRVVVTGSPGCGKSALLEILRSKGLPTYSADAEVARLYGAGGDGQRLLRAHFGDRFVPDPSGPVDKTALGAAMRGDDALRREVEALLHPLVWHALQAFWREQERDRKALAVAEIPLYLESGRDRRNVTHPLPAHDTAHLHPAPVLVGVHCPFALREERLTHKRGWSRETVARMESWQWPEEKKMRACDKVIDNTGTLADLESGAARLLEELQQLSESRENAVVGHIEPLWTECMRP